jgi:hypothetical protein
MSATIFHELEELRANILADDLEAVVNRHLLAPSVSKRVDFVLDNAGLELFTDFCMADFLLAKGLAAKCVMHGKASMESFSVQSSMACQEKIKMMADESTYSLDTGNFALSPRNDHGMGK